MTDIPRRRVLRGLGPLAAAAAGFGLHVRPARAATVVTVSLWDRGANSMAMLGREPMRGTMMPGMMTPGRGMQGRGMQGRGMQGMMMGITASPATVAAGEIEFAVTNASTVMIHEMIVAPLPDPPRPLPHKADEQRVDEDKARHLGEVSELDPGKTGALRITLAAGKYLLYCNIPGHYAVGMWTEFTVTG